MSHEKGGARPDIIEDEPLHPGARFTRRSFLATTGGAVAAASLLSAPRSARADDEVEQEAGAPLQPGAILRIHPAIGFARLGNSPSDYFIGPEVPGYGADVETYKEGVETDTDGKVKRQAARFRIYEYDLSGKPLREVNLHTPGVGNIKWTVHLANKKASFHTNEGRAGDPLHGVPAAPLRNLAVTTDRRHELEVDFGPRSIDTLEPVPFTPETAPEDYDVACPVKHANRPVGAGQPIIPYLGELRTDDHGRLLVLGAHGVADYNTASQPEMPHWANNDGWFDDASDGPVTVEVTLDDDDETTIEPAADTGRAWVLCGPPDFAPGVPSSVSAYDLLFDLAVRKIPVPNEWAFKDANGPFKQIDTLKPIFLANEGSTRELAGYTPHFGRDIEPMLIAAYNLWWVNALITAKHNSLLNPNLGNNSNAYKSARTKVYSYMRPPLDAPQGATGPGTMPKLMGDEPYIGSLPDAVRNLALTHVQYGMLGQWADGNFTMGGWVPDDEITAHGLDRAALENCVGGAFFPGIEFGWQMRIPNLFSQPFRISHGAPQGYLGQNGLPLGGTIAAGHFSRQMAVPWQADFNDCRNEGNYGWWPSPRPTHTLPSFGATKRVEWARPTDRFVGRNRESTHEDMVTNWWKFGFVVEETQGNQTKFVEKQRHSSIV